MLTWTLVVLVTATLAARELPFNAEWTLSGDARISEINGIPTLMIDSGVASFDRAEFEDGTIEVDFQASGHRSFVYLMFRTGEDNNREEIYLRAHKSNLPDALQYTPVVGGVSQWQIFHGDGGTAPVALPAEHWSTLRLEVKGRQLAVFVGDGDEPDYVTPRLVHTPRAGGIALRSFIPNGSEAPFGARFRNLRVRPGETSFDFSRVAAATQADSSFLGEWQVGPVFAAGQKLYDALPAVEDGSWRPFAIEPDGVALLHRLERPQGARAVGTVVRHLIDSPTATTRSLDVGFSDAISVFLNGRPIVGLDQSYRYDKPRVQGVLGLHQSRIHLPLKAGVNELQIVVTDSFGGWGLVARWSD